MCGRHWLDSAPVMLEECFDLSIKHWTKPRYNISPQSNVLSLFQSDTRIEITEMHWGLIPPWAKEGQFKSPLINARSETVWEKPSFRNLIKNQRCIIPVSGFFEWKREGKTKQPYAIKVNNQPLMLIGGIYQISKDGEMQHCIVTTPSNSKMDQVHGRQPVILNLEQAKNWMTYDNQDDKGDLDDLMNSCPTDWLDIYPVSNYVNNARNQGPECIARI